MKSLIYYYLFILYYNYNVIVCLYCLPSLQLLYIVHLYEVVMMIIAFKCYPQHPNCILKWYPHKQTRYAHFYCNPNKCSAKKCFHFTISLFLYIFWGDGGRPSGLLLKQKLLKCILCIVFQIKYFHEHPVPIISFIVLFCVKLIKFWQNQQK